MFNNLSNFEGQHPILCYYANVTDKIQVVRIENIANWYYEKVVFPGQKLMFEALPEAVLEIHTGAVASAILSDKIPCYVLRVIEEVITDTELKLPQERRAARSGSHTIKLTSNSARPARTLTKVAID